MQAKLLSEEFYVIVHNQFVKIFFASGLYYFLRTV